MKHSFWRNAFTVVMVVCMLFSFSVMAFADEVEDENGVTYADHRCVYIHKYYSYSYTPISNTEHEVHKWDNLECNICSRKAILDLGILYRENHTTVTSYTGTNEHVGVTTTHRAQYHKYCSACRYDFGTYWDTYYCPGNGACIYP